IDAKPDRVRHLTDFHAQRHFPWDANAAKLVAEYDECSDAAGDSRYAVGPPLGARRSALAEPCAPTAFRLGSVTPSRPLPRSLLYVAWTARSSRRATEARARMSAGEVFGMSMRCIVMFSASA